MLIVLFRTIILFLIVMITMRIMGKRQIGQLQPYELVVTIMVSELASLPMQDTRIPLLHGIIPIITLLLVQILISLMETHFQKTRFLLDGKPSVVIDKGKIVIQELESQLFTVNDLLEKLRTKGYFNINEIDYAILETNGDISIIPKASSEPVTKNELNIKSNTNNIPSILIWKGAVNKENLQITNKTMKWLENQLHKNQIQSPKEVVFAMLNSDNSITIQKFENNNNKLGEIDL